MSQMIGKRWRRFWALAEMRVRVARIVAIRALWIRVIRPLDERCRAILLQEAYQESPLDDIYEDRDVWREE